MPTATQEITPKSTMAEILEAYPSARRALFTRYHVGGCSSCGYAPTDTLETVMKNHNVPDVAEALEHIKKSQENDDRLQVSPQEVADLLKNGKIKLLDIRGEDERGLARIEGDVAVTSELAREIKESWPKDAALVVYCHHGPRSLDAAAYLAGHGFTNVKSLRGGVDAWSQEIDPLLPRY